MDRQLIAHMNRQSRQIREHAAHSAARHSGRSVLSKVVTNGQKETHEIWASRRHALSIVTSQSNQNANSTFQYMAGYDWSSAIGLFSQEQCRLLPFNLDKCSIVW